MNRQSHTKKVLEFIEKIFIYKFPNLSREEL
ncbi:Rpn family recombination-promoting nuclease/putative transposase [Nostoc sp. MS1]|nr:Rpn family recombination-promoting nuclease/putative transposase [Nostoc sp. MS1]